MGEDNDQPKKIAAHQFRHCTCVCSEPFKEFEIDKLLAIAYGRIYQEREDNFTHKAIIEFSIQVQIKNGPQNLPVFNKVKTLLCLL